MCSFDIDKTIAIWHCSFMTIKIQRYHVFEAKWYIFQWAFCWDLLKIDTTINIFTDMKFNLFHPIIFIFSKGICFSRHFRIRFSLPYYNCIQLVLIECRLRHEILWHIVRDPSHLSTLNFGIGFSQHARQLGLFDTEGQLIMLLQV